MASWSTNRRFLYGGSFVLVLAIISLSLFFKVFYRPPLCTDGIQNGDETGIDCGGSCSALCTSDTLSPIVLWSKVFPISGNVYNVAAYIENSNVNSSNPYATYEFKIFDDKNILLDSREGQTFIPRDKKFIVFEPGFIFKGVKPKRVEFAFTSFGKWQKDTLAPTNIAIDYSPLLATATAPRIEGTISNNSFITFPRVELSTIVEDSNENAIAVSQTFVDTLHNQTSQSFVFTWPKPFNLGVESCQNSLAIVLVLDRSTSMRSESTYPPEPFSTVKSVAENFIRTLSSGDQAGVVSFGTQAKQESPLSPELSRAQSAVDALFLSSTTEETNIGGGLETAFNELSTWQSENPGSNNVKQVVILLTDGVPNKPVIAGQPDYPKIFAQEVAGTLATKGITLYAIGLGKDADEGFLKTIALDDGHYFFAPTKATLSKIYEHIGGALCVKKPNAIQVIYRIVPTK